MKLRWYDRILVALSGLVLTAFGAAIILVGCGVIDLPGIYDLDVWTGGDWKWLPIIFMGGLIVLAWGLHLFVRALFPRRDLRGRYFSVKTRSDDTLHISVSALDQLIRKCLDARPEVLTSRIEIAGQERAMRVTIRVTLRSGVCIPEIVSQMQEQIKQYVTTCSGVAVDYVRVIVEATKESRGRADDGEVKLLQPVADEMPPIDTKAFEEEKQEAAVPVEEPLAEEKQPTAAEVPAVEANVDEPAAEEAPVATIEETIAKREEAELKDYMVDFGPAEPLPVNLSAEAFPFPGAAEKKPAEDEAQHA